MSDIRIVKLRLLATDEPNTIDGFLRRVVKVVHNDHFVAGFYESQGSERAYVAGPSTMMLDTEDSMKISTSSSYPVTRTEPTGIVFPFIVFLWYLCAGNL